MKNEIKNCLTWYANQVSETIAYSNWSDEYCRDAIANANKIFIDELKKHIDFKNLTRKEALELRFARWDESMPNLYLIPLYLVPALPIGIELTTIFGDKIVYNGTNIDTDTRFGVVAYGIEIKEDAA